MNRELLQKEIASALNKEGIGNSINTPDYILAAYLVDCLLAYTNCLLAYTELKLAVLQHEDIT